MLLDIAWQLLIIKKTFYPHPLRNWEELQLSPALLSLRVAGLFAPSDLRTPPRPRAHPGPRGRLISSGAYGGLWPDAGRRLMTEV